MRAQIIGLAASFEVQPEALPDGSMGAPEFVTLTMRPCWRRPPARYRVEYLYTIDGIAYYEVDEELV